MWTRHGGGELLFNIASDPMERRDLSKTDPGLAAEMKRMLTEQVKGYNAGLVRGGELVALPPVKSPGDVAKWPGFHSTYYPSDVLH
jgi:hypothetical protein